MQGVPVDMVGPPMGFEPPMGQPAGAEDWQPQVFEPVEVAMPVEGEARKRATFYQDEVMDPNNQAWAQQAQAREDILPNKTATAPKNMIDSDDEDDQPQAAK